MNAHDRNPVKEKLDERKRNRQREHEQARARYGEVQRRAQSRQESQARASPASTTAGGKKITRTIAERISI